MSVWLDEGKRERVADTEGEEESVSDSMKRPCKDFGFYSDEIRALRGK